tara:strand:+ start:265 stop:417 length:153 start_codon:yes stop_codon:yes gene_type:complete
MTNWELDSTERLKLKKSVVLMLVRVWVEGDGVGGVRVGVGEEVDCWLRGE